MVLHTWIIECLKMYKISDKIINLIANAMEHRRMEMIARGQTLTEVKIQSDIFQGDSLSLRLFVIARIPINHMKRICKGRQSIYKIDLENGISKG